MNEPIYAPAWTAQALCAQVDSALWFVDKGGSSRAAVAVCNKCPVKAECLNMALEYDERHGIWGGLSPGERTTIRRTAA